MTKLFRNHGDTSGPGSLSESGGFNTTLEWSLRLMMWARCMRSGIARGRFAGPSAEQTKVPGHAALRVLLPGLPPLNAESWRA